MERAHSVKMKPMWLPSVLLCAVSADSPEGTNTKSTASSGILPHRRGVHPDKYSFYDESSGVFTCLKHPDVQIPLESVNDDYCDCPDGSDEPGTSACSYVAGANFYCPSKRSVPRIIHSSTVNDGICDCCDGSDEWDMPSRENGGPSCGNTCAQEGKIISAKHNDRVAEVTQALQRKEELSVEYVKIMQQWRTELETQKRREVELDSRQQAAQSELDTLESSVQREKDDNTVREDPAVVSSESGSAVPVTSITDGQAVASGSASEAGGQFDTTVLTDANIDSPPEDGGAASNTGESGDSDSEQPVVSEYAQWMDKGNVGGSEKVEGDSLIDRVTSKVTNGFHAVKESIRGVFDKRTALEKQRDDHKTQLNDITNELNTVRSEVSTLQKNLEFYEGSAKQFIDLHDQCFEKDQSKYTFELCFFKNAHQREAGSRSHHLGDDVSIELEGKTKSIVFKNGAHCYNGPKRSVRVLLECGAETEFIKVDEVAMCQYQAVIKHASVCEESDVPQVPDMQIEL